VKEVDGRSRVVGGQRTQDAGRRTRPTALGNGMENCEKVER